MNTVYLLQQTHNQHDYKPVAILDKQLAKEAMHVCVHSMERLLKKHGITVTNASMESDYAFVETDEDLYEWNIVSLTIAETLEEATTAVEEEWPDE